MLKTPISTIAVIGASGMLALPVVLALLEKGFTVRAISRNPSKLQSQLDQLIRQSLFSVTKQQLQVIQADVHQPSSLKTAFKGCDAVHINLSGHTPKECYKNQVDGTHNIIESAHDQALKRITYLSGATTSENNSWHYDTQAKWEAENLIRSANIPYLIFAPSWFMETLPLFVQGKRATVFGPTTQKIHWLSAKDYANVVTESYSQNDEYNQRITLYGPETFTLYEALNKFVKAHPDSLQLGRLPYFFGHLLGVLTKNNVLKDATALQKYYETVGEPQTLPSRSNFNQPITQLDQWIAEYVSKSKSTN